MQYLFKAVRYTEIACCVIITSNIAVSNEVPEHPVVSPSSGAIFERRIIEKYILENGIDPISGRELNTEELIEIKSK